MGRKATSRTPASSSAAAASTTAPLFTSFAAATAHALRAVPGASQPSTHAEPSAWDIHALQLLKKLSKRDATTKLRALSDLSAHLSDVPSEVGADFVNAWGPAFSASALSDHSPAVRAALLKLMGLVVRKFPRLIQPIFPRVLPVWLAARGDVAPSVSDVAIRTFDDALATPVQREKVVTRYAGNLRDYCADVLHHLSAAKDPNEFLQRVSHVVAVLVWLVSVARAPSAVAPVIDAASDPLMLMARGPKQKKKPLPGVAAGGAIRDVCQLALAVLQYMQHTEEEDRQRAQRFASLALLGVRKIEPVAWDLVLVLLREGWSDAFGKEFEGLSQAVAEAVTAKFPTGLSALLPLFDALPRGPLSAKVVEFVLRKMKKGFCLSDKKEESNTAYVLAALPTYIECATFAKGKGCSRWLEGEGQTRLEQYQKDMYADHIVPSFEAFLCGQLPPIPKVYSMARDGGARRRAQGKGQSNIIKTTSEEIARALQGMKVDTAHATFETIAKSFVSSLAEKNADRLLERYLKLLGCISERPLQCDLAVTIVKQIIAQSPGEEPDTHAKVVSATLSSEACRNIPATSTVSSLSSDLLTYTKTVLNHLGGSIQEQDLMTECVKGNIGSIFSWVYWAANTMRKEWVLDRIFESVEPLDRDEDRMGLTREMLLAHKQRRELKDYAGWCAFTGAQLEKLVLDAADVMVKENGVQALSLVTAACDPQGGISLPLPILRQIAEIAKNNVMQNAFQGDQLLIMLLRSPMQYLETEQHFHDIIPVSFLRAIDSESVYAELLQLLLRSTIGIRKEHVSRIIALVHEQIVLLRKGDDQYMNRSARRTAELVSDIGPHIDNNFGVLCEEILQWSDYSFTHELLLNVPMSAIFGDGESMHLHNDRFLHAFEEVARSEKGHPDIQRRMQAFLSGLDPCIKGSMAGLITMRILEGSGDALVDLLVNICSENIREKGQQSQAGKEIAESLLSSLSHTKGELRDKFRRVPLVIRLCITASQGSFLESLQEVVEASVKIVRCDPFALDSRIALDILSAALTRRSDNDAVASSSSPPTLPDWLLKEAALVLLAVRRSLERPLGSSSQSIEALETHGGFFLSSLLRRARQNDVSADEFRFWAMRTRDVLRYYTREGLSSSQDRLASFSALGAALADLEGPVEIARPEIMEEISHYGAWAAAFLLPSANTSVSFDNFRHSFVLQTGSIGSAHLIVKAAERSVLLGLDGSIPLDVGRIYALAPQLASHTALVRKAVLTLMSFAAAVDLPERVADAFPKDGFSDEAKEIKLMTNLTPAPLRKALEWPDIHIVPDEKESDDYAVQELGYFLAWRLFLDLIHTDDKSGSAGLPNDVQEDVSFRRVGTTYLRSRPELYAQFFNKCVEVVVDGSITERVAAGKAAAEALRVEERAAQGVQLAQQQQEDVQDDDTESSGAKQYQFDSESEMDEEVGKAAGIAFARALQRLPALSRQHVTNNLDRGTAFRVESFVRTKISPLLIAAEIRKVKDWGAFGGGRSYARAGSSSASASVPAPATSEIGADGEGELNARGSVAGREVWATYTFSDVTLEIGMRLPDVFPLSTVEVEARSRVGMSEARWRKTLFAMTTLLGAKDGTLAEAVELWRRNLDKRFQGAEECPICYSVLHLTTAALPRMQCRTCKNLFHSECLCKWFTKSNSSACPLCRSAF